MKKIMTIVALFVTMTLVLSACSSTDGFLSGRDKKKETVTSTDVYIPIEKVRTLNPIIAKDEDSYYIDKLIYDGLFRLNDKLEPEPVLVSSYEFSDEGYTLTLDLKSGVKWHDGSDFTAADVKFSIEAYLSSADSPYYSYVNNIRSVTVKGNNTVVVHFRTNTNSSLENFVFPIIPKHQFKSLAAARVEDEDFTPIGTGAYQVESYDNYFELVLQANPNWHMGYIAQNRLLFEVVPNRTDIVNMMGMSKVSLTFSKSMERDAEYANKKVTMTSFPSNEVEFVGFNFGKKTFQNKMVRQAIAYATDTKKIIEKCYYKNGILNDNIYYPNYYGVKSKKDEYKYNIDKALELLTNAGYIDRDGDGLVEDAEGNKITINILVNLEDPARISAAQIIKEGLDRLPIETIITTVEWNEYNSALNRGDYDIFIGGFKIRENYDLRFLLHSAQANIIGYGNPELDELLDKMESGLTTEEKRSTFKQVKELLNEEIPYYCLLYKTYAAVTPETFDGKPDPLFNDFYRNCQEWKCIYEVNDISDNTANDSTE